MRLSRLEVELEGPCGSPFCGGSPAPAGMLLRYSSPHRPHAGQGEADPQRLSLCPPWPPCSHCSLPPGASPAALLPSSPADGSCRWVGGLRKRKSTKAETATILHCQAGSFSPALCRDAFLPARVPAYRRDLGATCCRAASVSFPINAISLKCSSLSALFIP